MNIGTPLTNNSTKVLLCGSGELGKEVAIELQRYGCEVIAIDRYDNAPAMQVAHRSYSVDMLDEKSLRSIIEKEKPNLIVPEVEAIATNVLVDLESEGFNVIPTARATSLTMNREGIRKLAAEELGLQTSPYRFASNKSGFDQAIQEVGIPCVVKPIMSSSGKGQSTITAEDQIEDSWQYAQEGGRAGAGKVIVEGFVEFDYEITLLTVRHKNGTSFCEPIGHVQSDGDYRQSWQPQPMTDDALSSAQKVAESITSALGGYGIFGVELFIKSDEVIFSEVSPRPHDTGLVTLISQDVSQFALHARAILGLPIPNIMQHGPSASSVILGEGSSEEISFKGVDKALNEPDTQIRLFGKPSISGRRRLGVAVARGNSIDEAKDKAIRASEAIDIQY
ncbi:MAG: formate-dependent phosphoribosylglycinamide formyltransferase [Verrucomicrobiota bacterium]|nr:formate-dependent phosphoribosylglycinamide formyltransferase [Verrucomicrobiota bacterium]